MAVLSFCLPVCACSHIVVSHAFCVRVCVRVCVYARVCTRVCVRVCVYARVCTRVCVRVCVYACVCVGEEEVPRWKPTHTAQRHCSTKANLPLLPLSSPPTPLSLSPPLPPPLSLLAAVDPPDGLPRSKGAIRKVLRLLTTLALATTAVLLFAASLPSLARNDHNSKLPALPLWPLAQDAAAAVRPYNLVNSYGLFRRMTGVEARPEVAVQGSLDGRRWEDVRFKYKPGLPEDAPRFIGEALPGTDAPSC